MRALEIFIAYSNTKRLFKNELIQILRSIRGMKLNIHTLKDRIAYGDTVSDSVDRLSLACDLAIILATQDDFVLNERNGDIVKSPRTRENIWIEYGYFWAKLGISRTLLIADKKIDIPSDISGYYIGFDHSIKEVKQEIAKHIRSLKNAKLANLTEILYLNNSKDRLSRDWRELQQLSSSKLVITGISFGNLRTDIPVILRKMKKNKQLQLTIIALDPFFMKQNLRLFKDLHGEKSFEDNLSFFITLHESIQKNTGKKVYTDSIKPRFNLKLFSGYFSGATVYCEDSFGSSHMIFNPFIYQARDRQNDYVRFRLKKRSTTGAFASIYSSLQVQMRKSKSIDLSWEENDFIKAIRNQWRQIIS